MGSIPPEHIRGHTPTSTAIYEAREIIARSGADWERFRIAFGALLGQTL